VHTNELVLIFEQLIAVNLKAFRGGEYRVAFYALAAALDAARSTKHVALVARVKDLALEQQAVIDATMPHHDLATRISSLGVQVSGYESLVGQAESIVSKLSSEMAAHDEK
jgi:hypothetical protein